MPRTHSVRVFFIALVLLVSPAALAQTDDAATPEAGAAVVPESPPETAAPPEEKLPEKDSDDTETEADIKARDLYAVGRDLYEGGRYQAALEVFEEAYALSPRPLLLLSLASTHERLGDYDKALEALRSYQPYVEENKRTKLDKRIESLEERLTAMEAQEEKVVAAPTPPPVVKDDSNLATWGWVLTGVGAALGLGGGAMIVLGEADYTDAEEGYSSGTMDFAEAEDLISTGETKHIAGYALAGVGGAMLVTGIILVVMDEDDAENDIQASFAPIEDGAVFTLMGRF